MKICSQNNYNTFLLMVIVLSFTSCVSKSDFESEISKRDIVIQNKENEIEFLNSDLKQARDSIKMYAAEIDKYKLDPSVLKASADSYYQNKDESKLYTILSDLKTYHPLSDETKYVTDLIDKIEKEKEAARLAEEKQRALEEKKNPHTAKGLAKKAARGGWVVGIWHMGYGTYATIVSRNNSYYMYNLRPQYSEISDEMRLRLVANGTYRDMDGEDDATYVVSVEGLSAYQYGTCTAFWESE